MNLTTSLAFFLALLVVSFQAEAQEAEADSGFIRIMVADVAVQIILDGTTIQQNIEGNSSTSPSWLQLRVSVGEHSLQLLSGDRVIIDTLFNLGVVETFSLDVRSDESVQSDKRFSKEPDVKEIATVEIMSLPSGSAISIDEIDSDRVTPSLFVLPPKEALFEVYRDGFEPLTKSFLADPGYLVRLHFLLRSLPPPPMVPESLGLFMMAEKPLQNEELANAVRDRYNNLAEVFAIVPLSQGLLAKALASESSQKEADILIAVGAGLSLGSYLLGKVFSKRKRRQIEEYNAQAKADNTQAKAHNYDVMAEVRQVHAKQLEQWTLDNDGKGRVLIEIVDDSLTVAADSTDSD